MKADLTRQGETPRRPAAASARRAVARGLADRPVLIAVALVGLLTALRLVAIFGTRLELYPDESQYWTWSRRLAFGYFSKPPMVAWLIAGTTALGGDSEPWVRLAAPFLHAVAALAVQQAAARLYDGRTGLLAAGVYALMPAVQLSSGVIATDAPLMAFLALGLWSYAVLFTARSRREGDLAALAFGTALALAALSKYAAVYAVAGAAIHAGVSRQARAAWSPRRLATAAGIGLLLLAPNLAWNAAHHFDTLAHTAANADWAPTKYGRPRTLLERLLDDRGVIGFGLGQVGVFGPVFFGALAVAAIARARRGEAEAAGDDLLLAFAAPPLILVFLQAVLSRANANWAVAAYVPGSVLAAAWLLRRRAVVWIAAGLGLQTALGGVVLVAALSPAAASGLGLDNSLKVARGWRESEAWVRAQAQAAQAQGGLSAIALDDRFLFDSLAYYGRGRPWPAPLKMWVREARPHNQGEAEAPLTPRDGRRVLMIDAVERFRPEAAADFARTGPLVRTQIRVDRRRARGLSAFIGEGFAPRPRDPRTGLPPRPGP